MSVTSSSISEWDGDRLMRVACRQDDQAQVGEPEGKLNTNECLVFHDQSGRGSEANRPSHLIRNPWQVYWVRALADSRTPARRTHSRSGHSDLKSSSRRIELDQFTVNLGDE
jgi:hypothetical protein